MLTTSAATTTEAPPTEEAAKVPKAQRILASGRCGAANEAAMSGAAGGDLNNVYRDSTMTSPEFAPPSAVHT
ncbi:hypothetical protein I6I11_00025 [Corynebacterium striatum]|uniref:hypothetical protein n=1 Tax=Corynebacterium striatum TaxID=43770 RepID=UPI0019104308|nr:hypothetical protein [Corynebacterium striatum]QQE53108.1 hypothetical protein I6I11_00025 [Corynebacterium striatum]